MKESIQEIRLTLREMCKGSNNITLLRALLAPISTYLVFLLVNNRHLFYLLLGLYDVSDFESESSYLLFLEGIKLDEISLIVPIISTIILLIPTHINFKKNPQLRLLPIKNWVKIAAYIFITFIATIIAITIVVLLDYSIPHLVHHLYYEEAVALQEKMGDLYKQVNSQSIIFWPNDNPLFIAKKFSGIVSLSLFFNLLTWIIFHLFKKYSLIKSIIAIVIILMTSFITRTAIEDNNSQLEWYDLPKGGYNSFYYAYVPLLILLFLMTIYYQLKQKEE